MSHAADTCALHERQQRLRELTEFTGNCRKQINDIYETLGWSADYEQEVMEQCPYDPAHRVPVRNMDKHKGSCRLTKMGYSAQEQEDLYDPSVCYENSSSVRSFHMDKSTQHQVILQARAAAPLMRMEGVFWQGQYSGQPVDVPQNHKRAVCDLTVADRLALYDHVAGVREKEDAASNNEDLYVDLVSKLQRDDGQNEPKTHLELMAEMRDYKRRRQSYRAKNVHITKKSYTEVIRDVINVHSEELTRQWRADEEEEEEVKKKKEDEEEKVKEEESTRSEHSSHRRRRSPSSESLVSRSRRRRERSQESEIKKKKREKKKERDSRSPCERKRKKKKKREEREKD